MSKYLGSLMTVVIIVDIFYPNITGLINKYIERAANILGQIILKIILVLFYFSTIIPLSFFVKKSKPHNTNFKKIQNKKINFNRLY